MKEKLPRTWAKSGRFWKAAVFGNQGKGSKELVGSGREMWHCRAPEALLLPLLSLGEGTVISHAEDFLLGLGVGVKAAPSRLPTWREPFPKVPVQNPWGGGTLGPAGLTPRAHARSWTPLHAPWPSTQRNNCRREGFGSISILDSTDPLHSSFKAFIHRFSLAA